MRKQCMTPWCRECRSFGHETTHCMEPYASKTRRTQGGLDEGETMEYEEGMPKQSGIESGAQHKDEMAKGKDAESPLRTLGSHVEGAEEREKLSTVCPQEHRREASMTATSSAPMAVEDKEGGPPAVNDTLAVLFAPQAGKLEDSLRTDAENDYPHIDGELPQQSDLRGDQLPGKWKETPRRRKRFTPSPRLPVAERSRLK